MVWSFLSRHATRECFEILFVWFFWWRHMYPTMWGPRLRPWADGRGRSATPLAEAAIFGWRQPAGYVRSQWLNWLMLAIIDDGIILRPIRPCEHGSRTTTRESAYYCFVAHCQCVQLRPTVNALIRLQRQRQIIAVAYRHVFCPILQILQMHERIVLYCQCCLTNDFYRDARSASAVLLS